METTLQELDRLMSAPSEGEHLEFKEAKTQFDQTKLCRYCIALANEGGGKLVLGVSDARPDGWSVPRHTTTSLTCARRS